MQKIFARLKNLRNFAVRFALNFERFFTVNKNLFRKYIGSLNYWY